MRSPVPARRTRRRVRSSAWMLNRLGWVQMRASAVPQFSATGRPVFRPTAGNRWTIAEVAPLVRPSKESPPGPGKPLDAVTERVVGAGTLTRAGWFLDTLPVAVEELPAAPDTHFVVHLPLARGGFRVAGRPVSVRMLAAAIRSCPGWKGRPVVLVCDGVVTAEALAPLLGSLASALGVTVAGSPGPVLLGPRLLLAQEGFWARGPGRSGSLELGRTLPPVGYRIRSGPSGPDPFAETSMPIATTAGAGAAELPADVAQLLADSSPSSVAVEKVGFSSGPPMLGGDRPPGPASLWEPGTVQTQSQIDAGSAVSVAVAVSADQVDVPAQPERSAGEDAVRRRPASVQDRPVSEGRTVATWTRVGDQVQEQDREHLRSLLGRHYEAHARAVSGILALQPGLRSAGTGADLMVGLVAVHAHLGVAGPAVDAVLRGEDPWEEDALAGVDAAGAGLLARCTSAGLRRLPVAAGPGYRAGDPPGSAPES
ncbi:hypothetical protein LWF15_25075, partial [Kineosporia rhizophila]